MSLGYLEHCRQLGFGFHLVPGKEVLLCLTRQTGTTVGNFQLKTAGTIVSGYD